MNSLKLLSKNNKLNQLVLYEQINEDMFYLLLNSSLLRSKINNPLCHYRDERHQLENYKKLFRCDKGAQIIYNKTKLMTYGRSNPENALGLFSLRREIRHTLTKDKYIDIDIVNCHPNILNQIALSNNITLKYLNEYNLNRDNILNEVINKYHVTRDQAKKLFIRLLYFGSFSNWLKDEDIKITEELPF